MSSHLPASRFRSLVPVVDSVAQMPLHLPLTLGRLIDTFWMIRAISEWWERVEKRVQTIEPPQARRIIVAVVGFTVLILGIVMLVLPGPALVVIPAGLAILAIEFTWARHWLTKVKEFAKQAADKVVPGAGQAATMEAAKGRADAHRMPS